MEPSGATFSNIQANPHSGGTSGTFGLGDAVHALTASLGIPECGGCAKRRERLNRLWRMATASDPLESYIIGEQETPP